MDRGDSVVVGVLDLGDDGVDAGDETGDDRGVAARARWTGRCP